MTEIFNVEGMSCNHCKMAVEKGVKSLKGVKKVEVNLEAKTVSVDFEKIDRGEIISKIDDLGYTVVQ